MTAPRDPYIEGMNAYDDGYPSTNPYSADDPNSIEWEAGYYNAEIADLDWKGPYL